MLDKGLTCRIVVTPISESLQTLSMQDFPNWWCFKLQEFLRNPLLYKFQVGSAIDSWSCRSIDLEKIEWEGVSGSKV